MPNGYGLGGAIGAGIDQGMKQNEIITLCLRSKGWNLERVADQGAAPPQ